MNNRQKNNNSQARLAGALLVLLVALVVSLAGTAVYRTFPSLEIEEARAGNEVQPPSASLTYPISKNEVMASDLSLHEALYWEKLPGGRVLCGLCPRQCVLRHGERGECRVRVNFDGSLYSLVFGKAVALHIDPIEKKPLFHFLPGTPILSVATAGCNLRCRFCQNWSISQAFPEKARHENLSPEQLVALANQKGIPSIAYTYTEPAIFYEYMLATAKLARAEGIKNVMVTCGYLNEEPLRELAQYLDGANVDLKGFSEDFYANYCGAKLQPVLDAIRFLYQQKVYIEITNLLIPGGNDDPEMIRKMCRWIIQETGSEVPLHFSRYHPDYKMERPGPTPLKTLRMAAKIAREEGLQFVYIGNVPLSEEGGVNGEETYCPKCNKLLLKRYGYFLQENHLVDGACPECGEVISGVWQPDKGQMQE